MAANPFTPTFGVSPPLLVGRDEEIADFVEALREGPGAPGRATLVTGARGAGKTVLLNALEDKARQLGWVVVSETARPGVVEDLRRSTLPALLRSEGDAGLVRTPLGANFSALGVGGGVTTQTVESYPREQTFRSELERLADVADVRGAGVLISLDELHSSALSDLRVIAQGVQHAFREGRAVAFVAAGLPAPVATLLDEPQTTFLRRAERVHVGPVADSEARLALAEPISLAGRSVAEEALDILVEGAKGYAFLLQLVGYHAWNVDRDAPYVTAKDAEEGVRRAVRRVGRLVHEPALNDLSDVDKSFLAAMAVDNGPSRTSEVGARLGVDANYASQYRRRLIAAELIQPVAYGYVDFTLPYLRDYLRDHAVGSTFQAPS